MLKPTDIIDIELLRQSNDPIIVPEVHLPIGQELDEIIAENVMGIPFDGRWSPSTDLNHAWQVWERLPHKRSLQIISNGKPVIACGDQWHNHPFSEMPVLVQREDLCLAICCAALVALRMVELTRKLMEGDHAEDTD